MLLAMMYTTVTLSLDWRLVITVTDISTYKLTTVAEITSAVIKPLNNLHSAIVCPSYCVI